MSAPWPPREGPLSGTVVVDLTRHVAGPACTKLLALYGATVIKVEEPRRGDPLRWTAPFAGDVPGADRGIAFLDLNVDKLGVTLDLRTDSGRRLLLQLLDRADVLVESFRPGVMAGWGFDDATLRARRPALVCASISNFGQDGPYRDLPASELVLQGMGHAMLSTGTADGTPLPVAPLVCLRQAGAAAALAVVAALLRRRLHGAGDRIDVSIMEVLLASIDRRADSLTAYAYTGETSSRAAATRRRFPPSYNRCRDGWFHLAIRNRRAWRRLLELLGDPSWVDDFADHHPLRPGPLADDFSERWARWCGERDKADIVARFQSAGLSCAPLNDVSDLLDDPHLRERGFFVELDHPVVGRARYAGVPFRMSATPGGVRHAAPRLGEHNEMVFGALGHTREDLRVLASCGVV